MSGKVLAYRLAPGGEIPKKIARVSLPAVDPVFGAHGPLFEHWR